MGFYWPSRTIRELADLPRAERRRVWRLCYRQLLKDRRTRRALLLCGGCGGLGALVGSMFGLGSWGAGIGGGIGGAVFGQVATQQACLHIRRELELRRNESTIGSGQQGDADGRLLRRRR